MPEIELIDVVCTFWSLFDQNCTTFKLKLSHMPPCYALKHYTTLHCDPSNPLMLSSAPVRLLKNICCSYPGNWVNAVCAQDTIYCTCRSWRPLEFETQKVGRSCFKFVRMGFTGQKTILSRILNLTHVHFTQTPRARSQKNCDFPPKWRGFAKTLSGHWTSSIF